MAKNYTFNEAVAIIAEGKDLEAITDISRRYPVLAHKVAVVATKAGEAFVDLMSYMPDYLTANKVNTAIKAGITETGSTEDDNDEDTDATDATEVTEGTNDATGDVDYESMSAKQLWDILGKAGLRKTAKSTKKADLVAACKAMDANKGATNDDEEDTESDNPYEGKKAMELFKECKARGIKATPKKGAKYYADLLIKDDAAKAESTTDEDDEWGDEETEAPPKKATSKNGKAKAASKKAAAATTTTTTTTDEDDEWDI